METGSAASYLLHIVNSTGAAGAYRIDGGNDQLPPALAARIADLRYGSPVAAVRQDGGGAQARLRNGETLARPEGRIHFAGEHASPWTGWMQGARESARRARDRGGEALMMDSTRASCARSGRRPARARTLHSGARVSPWCGR